MRFLALAIALISTAALADTTAKLVTNPAIGVETTAAPGDEFYSYSRLYSSPAVKLISDTKIGMLWGKRTLPAGTVLLPIESKSKLKACVDGTGPCLYDDDGDGAFDRWGEDEVTIAPKLKVKAPYEAVTLQATQADNQRFVLLFQGATSDTLRFSYREFTGDIARPAFTEDLTVVREPFPAMIKLKGHVFEVLSLGGMGLRYRLVS